MAPTNDMLTIYNFNRIASDLGGLVVTDFHKDPYYICPKNGETYRFHWDWHNYRGDGQICVINGLVDTTYDFCRESYLRIDKNSPRQASKHISEVYNEPALADLLQYIFRMRPNNSQPSHP